MTTGWTGWADTAPLVGYPRPEASSAVNDQYIVKEDTVNASEDDHQQMDGEFLSVNYQVLRKGAQYDDGPQPLHDFLFCESCNGLLTQHPRDIICEIESFYCPQGLDNLPSSEAIQFRNRSSRVFCCVECPNLLSTHVSTAGAFGETGGEAKFYFLCQHCRWDSLDAGLVADSPEALRKLALAKEAKADAQKNRIVTTLTSRFRAMETANSSGGNQQLGEYLYGYSDQLLQTPNNVAANEDKDEDKIREFDNGLWRWKECDAALTARIAELSKVRELSTLPEISAMHKNKNVNETDVTETAMPTRPNLRTKLAYRCRRCADAGLPNIVLKPQINPLKGDSSMRTNVGAWFKKKSAAYDHLPRVVARRDTTALWLAITNPCDTEVIVGIEFANNGGSGPAVVRVDAFDEIEELDLISSRRPVAANAPREGDPSILSARLANKVLLKLPLPSELPLTALVNCTLAEGKTSTETGEAEAPTTTPATVHREVLFQLHVG